MTIRIEITDPHLMSREEIAKTAKYLMGMVGLPMVTEPSMFKKPLGDAPTQERGQGDRPTTYVNGQEINVSEQEIKFSEIEKCIPHSLVVDFENPLKSTLEEAVDLPCDSTHKMIPIDDDSATLVPSEVDSAGMPYDDRIHSSGRGKMKDGRWRYMRNIPRELIMSVEHELIHRKTDTAIPTPPEPRPAADVFAKKGALPLVNLTPPNAPPMPVPPVPSSDDLPELYKLITAAIKAGKLTHVQVTAVLKVFGIPSLNAVGEQPHLIPRIKLEMEKTING